MQRGEQRVDGGHERDSAVAQARRGERGVDRREEKRPEPRRGAVELDEREGGARVGGRVKHVELRRWGVGGRRVGKREGS